MSGARPECGRGRLGNHPSGIVVPLHDAISIHLADAIIVSAFVAPVWPKPQMGFSEFAKTILRCAYRRLTIRRCERPLTIRSDPSSPAPGMADRSMDAERSGGRQRLGCRRANEVQVLEHVIVLRRDFRVSEGSPSGASLSRVTAASQVKRNGGNAKAFAY